MLRNEDITKIIRDGHHARGRVISITPMILPLSGPYLDEFITKEGVFDFELYSSERKYLSENLFLECDDGQNRWVQFNEIVRKIVPNDLIPNLIREEASKLSDTLSHISKDKVVQSIGQVSNIMRTASLDMAVTIRKELIKHLNQNGFKLSAENVFDESYFRLNFNQYMDGFVERWKDNQLKVNLMEFRSNTFKDIQKVAGQLSVKCRKFMEINVFNKFHNESQLINYPSTKKKKKQMESFLWRAWCEQAATDWALEVAANFIMLLDQKDEKWRSLLLASRKRKASTTE